MVTLEHQTLIQHSRPVNIYCGAVAIATQPSTEASWQNFVRNLY